MIIDTHCHLNDEQLYDIRDEIIKNAKAAGVEKLIVIGYDKESSFKAVSIAEEYDNVYAAVGYHPTEIFDLSEEDFQSVMDLLKHPKVVALGEIGLDYHWIKDPEQRELQKKYFIRQIEEANKVGKPISVHDRESTQDCLDIIKAHTPKYHGVMHCFSGSVEMMREFIKCGMYISLGGTVTFTNAKTPKEVAVAVPLDRLVVETDSPYLAPHPKRGTRNEPANTRLVVEKISELRNISIEEVEKATSRNAFFVFHV